jgi:surfactin synthase thioesterase subunit
VHSAAVLEQRLREYGGSPASLFADPARLEQAVQLYGDDLRLTETYPKAEIANVPHVFWYGTEDSTHDAHRLRRWSEHAGGSPEMRAFPGGHFFLFETSEPASALAAQVAAAHPARV